MKFLPFAFAGHIAVVTATELQCHLWLFPFFFSKLKSVFYQDEPRLFLNAFGIVQDSESILPQKIPSCHICKDICENISISLLG